MQKEDSYKPQNRQKIKQLIDTELSTYSTTREKHSLIFK